MIYYDLCVYGNPCPRFWSTTIIRHASLSEEFEESSSLSNFGRVQRNLCWLFDLELAIVGSCYLLLALSRHPDLAGDTCFFSASRSVSTWMLSSLLRVGRGVPGLPFEPGPTMPTRIPGPTRPTRINLNLSIRSTANWLNPALLCYFLPPFFVFLFFFIMLQ